MSGLGPETLAKLERLAAAGIRILPLPGVDSHFALERDGYAVLVAKSAGGFGEVGSAGLVTEEGLAVLVWRNGRPYFVTRRRRIEATSAQVEELRRFSAAVEEALGAG